MLKETNLAVVLPYPVIKTYRGETSKGASYTMHMDTVTKEKNVHLQEKSRIL